MKTVASIGASRGTAGAGISFSSLPVRRWMSVFAERRRLASLDADRLADIGVSEGAAASEAARPFWDVTSRR